MDATEGETPPQTPEGRLIELAAAKQPRKTSELAAEAGISAQRWRHIVRSAQSLGGGKYNAVRAPAQTLARMAQIVGVSPAALAEAGRPDAAQFLEDLQGLVPATHDSIAEILGSPASTAGLPDQIEMIYASQSMTAEQKLEAIRMVLHLRAQADTERAANTQPRDKPVKR